MTVDKVKLENLAPLVIAIAAAVRIFGVAILGFEPFDDSFITFRYALNLASGHGFVYNWGEHVLGTTTPLWTILLVPAVWLHVPLADFSIWTPIGFDISTAVVMFRLLKRLAFPLEVGTAAAVLFLLNVDYLAISLSGMESSLFVFLIVAAIYSIVLNRALLAGVLAGLAVMTRPEGVILGFVFAATILQTRSNSSRIRRLVLSGAGALIVLMPWVSFATCYFGSPISQSVIAKYHVERSAELHHFSNRNLLQFVIHGQYGIGLMTKTYLQGQVLLMLASVIGTLAIAVEADAAAACALIVFPAAFAAIMGMAGAFTWHPWYYAPFYPFIAALASIGMVRLSEYTRVRRTTAVVGLLGVLLTCYTVALVNVKLPASKRQVWVRDWSETAARVPKDETVVIAADEIGALGWFAYPTRIYDLVGLVTPNAVYLTSEQSIERYQPDFVALRIADSQIDRSRLFKAAYSRVTDVPYFLWRRNYAAIVPLHARSSEPRAP